MNRFAALDGIRGIASLYVMYFHVSMFFYEDMENRELLRSSSLVAFFKTIHFGILFYGHYAVVAFITLSGFCLMLPHAERTSMRGFSHFEFLRRRLWRIYPPYLVGLFLGVAVCATSGWQGPLEIRGVWQHLLLIHNWTDQMLRINGALWSVGLEFQIYLLFAALLLPVMIRFGAAVTFAISVLVSAILLRIDLFGAGLVIAFALGMLAAKVYKLNGAWMMRIAKNDLAWYSIAGIVCLLIAFQDRRLTPAWIDLNARGLTWVLEALFASIVSVLILRVTQPHDVAARYSVIERSVLENRVVVMLGLASYSIYLVHVPLFGALRYFFPPLSDFRLALVVYYFVWPLVIICVSICVYKFVEIPSMKRARNRKPSIFAVDTSRECIDGSK